MKREVVNEEMGGGLCKFVALLHYLILIEYEQRKKINHDTDKELFSKWELAPKVFFYLFEQLKTLISKNIHFPLKNVYYFLKILIFSKNV